MAAVAKKPAVLRESNDSETISDDNHHQGVGRDRATTESTFGPSASQHSFPRNSTAGSLFINGLERLPSDFSLGRPPSEAGPIKDPPSRPASIIGSLRQSYSEATINTSVSEAENDDAASTAASTLTVTRTINRVEDYPKDKPPAVGTVLEEETPKPVQLMVEFLGGDTATSVAARDYIDALYTEPMELSVECQFLPKIDIFSNTDPFCVLYIRDNSRDSWRELGRTEKLTNCHFPRFVKKFCLTALPDQDMDKEVLIKVYGKGSVKKAIPLGHSLCSVWDVVISPGQCKVMKMDSINPNKDTWIILSGDIVRKRGSDRIVTVNVKFDKSAKPRAKTFYVLNRSLKKARWTPIYRSEGHTHSNREFEPAQVSYADLFCGDEKKPMRLEFYQKRAAIDPKLVGFVQVSMKQIEAMEEGRVLQWWSGQDGIAPGLVVLAKKEISDSEINLWFAVTNE